MFYIMCGSKFVRADRRQGFCEVAFELSGNIELTRFAVQAFTCDTKSEAEKVRKILIDMGQFVEKHIYVVEG
jgi:hypothetical protein